MNFLSQLIVVCQVFHLNFLGIRSNLVIDLIFSLRSAIMNDLKHLTSDLRRELQWRCFIFLDHFLHLNSSCSPLSMEAYTLKLRIWENQCDFLNTRG